MCVMQFDWLSLFVSAFSYSTYSNEVSYGSPYGYSASVTSQQTMGYDISADYVDSTTTYEPRSTTIIDSDFIGGHSKSLSLVTQFARSSLLLLFFEIPPQKKYFEIFIN